MKILVHTEKDITLDAELPLTVEELLRREGIAFSMPCGGNHTCGKCRIRVKGAVSAKTDREAALLGDAAADVRLACLARVIGDCEIFLAEKEKDALIVSDGIFPSFSPEPLGKEYGIAADIGTTTVAVYLYELKNGKRLAKTAFANPQSAFGADVISRVQASMNGNGDTLRTLIGERLSEKIQKLCDEAGIPPSAVDAAVITGNTAMLYLLLGRDTACLSAAPFEISDRLGRCCSAAECGIGCISSARIYLPRAISAFVGSDITCSLLAVSDIMRASPASLMIDIGTNGEMAVIRGDKLFCCSTAAGPAFEGAGITMGTMALPGAVNKVWLSGEEIRYSTVGGADAAGVCGSGIVDALAVFLQCGLVDVSGRIEKDGEFSRFVCEHGGQPALKIGNSGVLLTQKDIRALQLAKSAIRAGIEALLSACAVSADDVSRLILAGGFGSYIDADSAAKIGLIPPVLAKKTIPAGNAAGMGAAAVLLSETAQKESVRIADASQTLELSASPFFMNAYIENMLFSAAQ